MAQIKTWVANTWVKLLQTTGQSTNKAMSQKAVTDSLDSLKSDLINQMYPIGSIYLTVETSATGSSSPAQWLGGTWERLPENKALWTASSDAGTTIDAGLPNIKGEISAYTYEYGFPDGVFSSNYRNEGIFQVGTAGKWIQFVLDASKMEQIVYMVKKIQYNHLHIRFMHGRE